MARAARGYCAAGHGSAAAGCRNDGELDRTQTAVNVCETILQTMKFCQNELQKLVVDSMMYLHDLSRSNPATGNYCEVAEGAMAAI